MNEPGTPGRFGVYGGQFAPETLMTPLRELEESWEAARTDPAFLDELKHYLKDYAGRPTPLGLARNLSTLIGPEFRVYLKRSKYLIEGAAGVVPKGYREP